MRQAEKIASVEPHLYVVAFVDEVLDKQRGTV